MLLSELDSPPSYRAPEQDGQCLSVPRWSTLPALATGVGNERFAGADIFGESLAAFRSAARAELLTAARRYVAGYSSEPLTADPRQPLVAVGHQPELVHPGVWLKNFAAAELARQTGGVALHLVIDTDAAHSPAIRVPSGTIDEPAVQAVAFDAPHAAMAWEQRRVGDRRLWESFGDRVAAALGQFGVESMAPSWWPGVVERTATTASPGLAMAQARHLTELSWGANTLELPQSEVCRSVAFRKFACHLLAHLPRFSTAYNEALAAFRRRHRIRNHAQPMPNLAEDGQWLEAPLWIWSDDDPRRRAVFVRQRGDQLEATDRENFRQSLPLTADGDPAAAVEQLARWERKGVKLRSRALVTTLFARLALADLFIHGIGGARYDEATDRLSESFFGVAPAPYAAVSGTLRLPIEHQRATPDDLRRLRHKLRQLEYHPERLLAETALPLAVQRQASELATLKRDWVATVKTPQNAGQRHLAIGEANSSLAGLLEPLRQATELELAVATRQVRATTLLESRDFAFCLFPQERLQRFLLDFAAQLA